MNKRKSNIKFTVIIPTRERPDTLKWSLKTCTEQNYENFEIIVCDNFSEDETREVVESVKDSRVRYINPGKRLSMASNYDFALPHATGDYVCIIGDDDGVMPDALEELNEVLHDGEIEAVSWKKPIYVWKQFYQTELQNTLRGSLKTDFRQYDSSEAIRKLLTFAPQSTMTFNDLACIYHGFVKVDTINKLRLPDNRFFNSVAPDVYASLIISFATKYIYQTEVPYTLHGTSKHSIGSASRNTDSANKFLSESDIPSHPNIKIVPISAPICIADCFLKIKEDFSFAKNFDMDIKAMLEKAVLEAVGLSPENYKSVVESVKFTGKAYGIENFVNLLIKQNPNSPAENSLILPGYDFINDQLLLKFDDEIQNVYDATFAYKEVLNRKSSYYVETIRYLANFTKNFGIGNTMGRGISRILKQN